jgi:hypothetical protein
MLTCTETYTSHKGSNLFVNVFLLIGALSVILLTISSLGAVAYIYYSSVVNQAKNQDTSTIAKAQNSKKILTLFSRCSGFVVSFFFFV